jgi:hypothetical protein
LHYLVVASNQVIPAQCKGVVIAWLESPLGVESGLKDSSLDSHNPDGLYIARTLVQVQQEVSVQES